MHFLYMLTAISIGLLPVSSFAQSEAGGYDIEGSNIVGTEIDQVGQWVIQEAFDGRKIAYCSGSYDHDRNNIRLGFDGGQWQLAIPVSNQKDWQGKLLIDGKGSGRGYGRGSESVSGTVSGGWTIVWLTLDHLDGLSKGRLANLKTDPGGYDFPLINISTVISKIKSCYETGKGNS